MADESRPPGRSHAFVMSALILSLPLVYILSIGPVALYYQRVNQTPSRAVCEFYKPLDWSYQHTVMRHFFHFYFRLLGARP